MNGQKISKYDLSKYKGDIKNGLPHGYGILKKKALDMKVIGKMENSMVTEDCLKMKATMSMVGSINMSMWGNFMRVENMVKVHG